MLPCIGIIAYAPNPVWKVRILIILSRSCSVITTSEFTEGYRNGSGNEMIQRR